MEKHTKRFVIGWAVAIGLLVICLVGLGVFTYLHSNQRRLDAVKDYLRQTYDISLTDGGYVTDNSFYVQTSEGYGVYGTCNWYGKVKSDSYLNIKYDLAFTQHIQEEVGGCFTECIVVTNHLFSIYKYFDNDAFQTEYQSNQIQTYEEYIEYQQETREDQQMKLAPVFIYVRESESMEHVESALTILKSSREELPVRICMLSDEEFEMHQKIGRSIYWNERYLYDQAGVQWPSDEYFFDFYHRTIEYNDTFVGEYSPADSVCRIRVNDTWSDL